MTGIAALVAYAALTLFAGPLLLSRGHWRLHWPRLCLLAWHLLFVSGLLATVAAVGTAIWLGMAAHAQLPAGQEVGDAGKLSWFGQTTDILAAWIALGLTGGLLSLVSARVGGMLVAERQTRETLASLVRNATYRRELVQGIRVTFISSPLPIACSLPGKHAEIVVSSRVDAELTAAEIAAVVAHERAHVAGRHHWAMRLAAINCACLPQLLGPRELRRATALLIELIADDQAAKACGIDHVSAALAKLGVVGADEGMRLRAERLQVRALSVG